MHEVIKMGISNNLKKGLSQEQLAKQLNISRQAVSKWEMIVVYQKWKR